MHRLDLNSVANITDIPCVIVTDTMESPELFKILESPGVKGLSGRFVSQPDMDFAAFKDQCEQRQIRMTSYESMMEFSQFQTNEQGLLPVIVQHYKTQEVLMLAYMNAESLRMTMELGEAVYYSRSRQEIWHKGATSGHVQKVKQILVDCDQDALIVLVDQCGAGACHTGHHSCFYRSVPFGDELKAQPQGGAVTLREADGGVVFDAEAVYGKGH